MTAIQTTVTILSGFLGAGKSTLINGRLAEPAVKDIAIVVNEFGEISIEVLGGGAFELDPHPGNRTRVSCRAS